jgi:hypothetical protein
MPREKILGNDVTSSLHRATLARCERASGVGRPPDGPKKIGDPTAKCTPAGKTRSVDPAPSWSPSSRVKVEPLADLRIRIAQRIPDCECGPTVGAGRHKCHNTGERTLLSHCRKHRT